MKALVIIHLSSLDAYAQKVGVEEAFELAGRLKEAILSWSGPVYIVDQRWPKSQWSEPRWNLVTDVQLQRDINWIHYDDNAEDWDIFMMHLRKQLLHDGVKEVVLGGVWHHPGNEGGCVSEIYHVFKRNLRVKVDENLVGCWPTASGAMGSGRKPYPLRNMRGGW